MEAYDDARSYRRPMLLDDAVDMIASHDTWNVVGYDDEEAAFGIVGTKTGEIIDSGIRIVLSPYPNLEGPVGKKSRRIINGAIVIKSGDWRARASGVYVNCTREQEFFCHWPNAQFGNQNHLEFAYGEDRIALVPYVLASVKFWFAENSEAEPVVNWIREHTRGGGDVNSGSL